MLARRALFSSILAALALAGCGTPGVGEPCAGSPELGGCQEGSYCVVDDDAPVRGASGDPSWESFTCRLACNAQSDCATTELCEPIPGTPTRSACRPRSTP